MKQLFRAITMCAAFSTLCGCATMSLNNANDAYDSHSRKNITITENSFSADVYQAESNIYFELRHPTQTYYIASQLYGPLSLVDTMPGGARKIGETAIRFISKEEFDKIKFVPNETDIPKEVYVVTKDNISPLSSKDDYFIFYMTKKVIRHDPVQNKLSLEGSKRVISALRNPGYLVTVPYDIVTTPIILLLNLPVVHK